MTEISQAMLFGAFGTRNVGQTSAKTAGIRNDDFKKYDKDQDNKLSLSEILGNQDLCTKLLTRINEIQAVLVRTENEESKLQKEKSGERNLLKEDTSNYPDFQGFNIRERQLVIQA